MSFMLINGNPPMSQEFIDIIKPFIEYVINDNYARSSLEERRKLRSYPDIYRPENWSSELITDILNNIWVRYSQRCNFVFDYLINIIEKRKINYILNEETGVLYIPHPYQILN